MLSSIIKVSRPIPDTAVFSIVIPSWNNLPYLQLCLRSLRDNSAFQHQVIVLVNDGSDGTTEWLQNETDFTYVHAEKNIGICLGLNACRSLVKTDHIVYANDDMYFLPDWDKALYEEVKRMESPYFMLSATMVEPNGANPCCLIRDFGTDLSSFKEKELLAEATTFHKNDWSGASWPPSLVPTSTWDLVGGMSVEFSPGMYSDPDLSKKLWEIGVRIFKGVGRSFVYHFGSKSTKRIRKNRGKLQFVQKWGITARFFYQTYLKLGKPYQGPLPDVADDTPAVRWHRLFH